MPSPAHEPKLSPVDERALEKLRELARDGVVEGVAGDLAAALGYRYAKSLQERVSKLVAAGLVERLNRPGSRGVRLRLAPSPRAVEAPTSGHDLGSSGLDLGPSGLLGGRGAGPSSSSLPLETRSTAAAAAAAVVQVQGSNLGPSGLDLGPFRGVLRLEVAPSPELTSLLLALLGRGGGASGALDLSSEETVAVEERFAQAKENGEFIKSRARIQQLVVQDCRTKPGVLAEFLASARRRAEREADRKAARGREQAAQQAEVERTRAQHRGFRVVGRPEAPDPADEQKNAAERERLAAAQAELAALPRKAAHP